MPIELRQQRQAIPQAPRVQVLARLSVRAIPLNPVMTDFLQLLDNSIASSAAVGSTPRGSRRCPARDQGVVGGEGVWALGRRRSIERLRRRGRQLPVKEGTRVAIALARSPVIADLVLRVRRRRTQPMEHALVAPTVYIHRLVKLRPSSIPLNPLKKMYFLSPTRELNSGAQIVPNLPPN